VRCDVHSASYFTLYPPGHVPHGRIAVAPLTSVGTVLIDRERQEPSWNASVFVAALDAAAGERWLDDVVDERNLPYTSDRRRRRTQGRWLVKTSRLLGLAPEQSDSRRELVAARLMVPLLTLRTLAAGWLAMSWRMRGQAVRAVLGELLVDNRLADRLLAAGSCAGLWPAPRRWDPSRRSLLGRTTTSERSDPRPVQARAPPSTNSPADRDR
jgi:hypothetical protein